jgi:hypothetical protein
MNKELIAATMFASQVYGPEAGVKPRKLGGVWYVALPPHPRREEVAAAFGRADVFVLADIRRA